MFPLTFEICSQEFIFLDKTNHEAMFYLLCIMDISVMKLRFYEIG
jgi:hypothetical protein